MEDTDVHDAPAPQHPTTTVDDPAPTTTAASHCSRGGWGVLYVRGRTFSTNHPPSRMRWGRLFLSLATPLASPPLAMREGGHPCPAAPVSQEVSNSSPLCSRGFNWVVVVYAGMHVGVPVLLPKLFDSSENDKIPKLHN